MTESAEKLNDLVSDIRIAMLTTVDDDGTLVSRPMARQAVELTADTWFFVARDSETVRHVTARPQVNLALSDASSWVSVKARAEVVDDAARKKELWNPMVEAWFPDGPDDDNVVLLRLAAQSAEYWDSPGGRVATAISLIKTKLTGEPYGGRNEIVDL